MAAKEWLARVSNKRDTSANWTANNPVLVDGEIIIVDTASGETRKKIGDGVRRYIELPFDDEIIRSLINDRVAISQGIENAGKLLGVGIDGMVVPVSSSDTGGAKTWGDMAGLNH